MFQAMVGAADGGNCLDGEEGGERRALFQKQKIVVP